MAWYTTGTIAVSGTTVTGTGTNFLDNTQAIGPGQALLIPGSGAVKMYEVASVQSATKLTLKTSAGTIAAGQAYAILSFYTDSVPDFARRLAAQLSYYQTQMDGWQQIMTGTGSITMTAPDGTSVTISSFSKLTADVAAALPQMGNLGTAGVTDINNLGPVSGGIGIWDANNSASYSLPNIPEAQAGVLEVLVGGGFRGTQRYTTRYGNIYIRSLTASWNATSPSWGPWCLSGFTYRNQSSLDLNTLTNAAFVGGTLTNGPAAMGNATCFVSSIARFDGALIFQTAQYTTTGRMFTRSCVSGTWTGWAESYTTLNKPLAADIGAATLGSTPSFSAIELYSPQPFIDFHFNNTNTDYTARIINSAADKVAINFGAGTGYGNLQLNGSYQCRQGYSGAYNNNGFNFFWNTSAQLEAWVDTSRVGAVTMTAISDKGLKKDIVYLSEEKNDAGLIALSEVLEWKVATFKYKERGIIPESGQKTGFIANDLILTSPETVTGQGLPEDYDISSDPNNPDAYGLDQIALIAKLTLAIQAQQNTINSQKTTIAELQNRMKAIDGLDA